MRIPFCEALAQSLAIAEDIYDHVIRRWGNIKFAQSSVYDWVWSDDFESRFQHLNELERGKIRIHLLGHFRVKPWPWYRNPQSYQSNTSPDMLY